MTSIKMVKFSYDYAHTHLTQAYNQQQYWKKNKTKHCYVWILFFFIHIVKIIETYQDLYCLLKIAADKSQEHKMACKILFMCITWNQCPLNLNYYDLLWIYRI